VSFSRHLAHVRLNLCALLNGKFEATATEDFSSRSVMIWNNSSAPLVSSCT